MNALARLAADHAAVIDSLPPAIAAHAVRLSEEQMDRTELIASLEKEMFQAAEELDFEKAARLRDRIKELSAGSTPGSDPLANPSSPDPKTQPRKRGPRGLTPST